MNIYAETCRLCLLNSAVYPENENLFKMLSEVFMDRFQFSEGIACSTCIRKLEEAYNFVLMVKESQLKLQKILSNPKECVPQPQQSIEQEPLTIIDDSSVKTEPASLDTDVIKISVKPPEKLFDTNIINTSSSKTNILKLDKTVLNKKHVQVDKNFTITKTSNEKDESKQYSNVLQKLNNQLQELLGPDTSKNYLTRLNVVEKREEDKNELDDTTKTYDCTKCGVKFAKLHTLKNHIRTIHNEFVCNSCNSIFGSERIYKKHLEQICYYDTDSEGDDIEKFVVEGINYREPTTLNKSNPTDGPLPTTRMCEICGNFIKSSIMASHVNMHRKKKSKMCEKCGKIYKNACRCVSRLGMGYMGERKFTCKICDKKFFQKSSLTSHIKRKHVLGQSDPCVICKKTFHSRDSLRAHMRQHTDERPYSCEICGMAYRHNVSLKTHKKSKHNIVEEVTIHCQKCGKGFGSETALFSHQKVHL